MIGAGLTVFLAACGSESEQPPVAQPNAPGDGKLAKAGDVPVGSGVVSPDGVLVLQLTEGQFTAFDAICPHQAFRVSPPDASGVITCGAHQSRFRAADGSRIDGLAPSGLKAIPVQVKEGYVVKIAM
ncbi:MAG TPA: Rieske (2Fe-2S) protein [Candidatus Limnocylindrales bacterium]